MGQMSQAAVDPKKDCDLLQIGIIRLAFVEKQRHDDILLRCQYRKQSELLEDKANLLAAERRQLLVTAVMDAGIAIQRLAGSWRVQSADDVEQRTFTTTGRPHNGDEITGVDFHICMAQRNDFILACTVILETLFT